MQINFLRLALLSFCLMGLSASAAPLAVGDALPVFSANDQNGKTFCSTNGFRFLLVTTEMACSKAANLKLAEQGAGFLEKHQAAYVMDIHLMPGIARYFALPKMRKYPQRIILVETKETLVVIPVQASRVTVLTLTSAGRVEKIGFWNPASEPATVCFP